MYDEDMINEIVLENRRQEREERELKNKILSMSNSERKQKLWHKYFPTPIQLSSNEVY